MLSLICVIIMLLANVIGAVIQERNKKVISEIMHAEESHETNEIIKIKEKCWS